MRARLFTVGPLSRRFNHAAHPEVPLGIDLDAMHLALESRELLAELFQCEQESNRRTVRIAESLARHADRNPRRIWHQHHRRNTPRHLREPYFLRALANELLISLRRSHHRIRLHVERLLQ